MKSKIFPILFILITFAALTVVIAAFEQKYQSIRVIGYDFETFYVPAARVMLAGESPYQVDGFYNPFWVLIPVIPFALMPAPWGFALFASVNIFLYTFSMYRLGVRNLPALVLLTVTLGMVIAMVGNIEGFFLLGMVLPQPLGLFFLMAKPQTGAAVAIVMAWIEYRQRGMVGLSRLFLPLLGGLLLSILLYGDWFTHAPAVLSVSWNVSLWPWGLVIGLPLLGAALIRKDLRVALMSAPFLSPYVAQWGYGYVIIGALSADWSDVRDVVKDVCSGALPLCEFPRFLLRMLAKSFYVWVAVAVLGTMMTLVTHWVSNN